MIEFKEKSFINEQRLNSQLKSNKLMQQKLAELHADLVSKDLQISHSGSSMMLMSPPNNRDESMSEEHIIDNLKMIIKEQFEIRNATAFNDVEELRFCIHDLKIKLQHEKLQNESLEIKFKLIDQDNQNLRQSLLASTKKFNDHKK